MTPWTDLTAKAHVAGLYTTPPDEPCRHHGPTTLVLLIDGQTKPIEVVIPADHEPPALGEPVDLVLRRRPIDPTTPPT